MPASIGFIGLGAMGWPMAARLVHYPLMVFDIDTKRSEAFTQEIGGVAARTLAELAAASDVVITMLPTSRHVETVLSGKEGVFANCGKDTLFIEMSSGAPQQTRLLALRAREADCQMIDAPVSGGVPRAITGDLSIMVGGEAYDIERADPILRSLGSNILLTGPIGTGHAMKAINNLVSACTLVATVEAVKLGERSGLDPKRVVDIINVSTGMSNSSLKKMHQFILSETFNSGFGLDLMVKDLNNAMDLAQDANLVLPLSDRCVEIWREAQRTLGHGLDHTDIARTVTSKRS